MMTEMVPANSRPAVRAALQGHETMPKTRGGGVAGTDYEDEHEAFAASRSSDYIYESGNETAFEALDSHAETIEGDVKLPLVITGSTGCGKSALLANWVNRRRKMKHRDEFLFQHFVGCSPRSKQLAHLLYRLESALKEHFQLREMEVPTSEERLRWSLNRFLAAAAKKQFPARIVIVLDAVNRLRGESSAADTLHWLPTELPQGVRIIVSTVELEQCGLLSDDLYDEGSRIHRTYTELRRRKCPTIRLQPLSVEVRHLIIGSFLKANQQALQSLEQAQQFRLVTAKASSQPLFLRTILYALRLGFEMSDAPIDQQIDLCLAAETSSELIACVLEMCSEYVDSTCTGTEVLMAPALSGLAGNIAMVDDCNPVPNILARVLTALYASRHGLSDMEMWGIVELATGDTLPPEQRECIRRVLRDFTFSVNGLRNFSHEDYAAVVYNEYIRVPEVHVRAHQLMARYFGKLPPCDRKLDALPYHLEVSGSWPRLRAALVDVQMFRLWWTPAHKTEFLNLWASLTACSNPGAPIRKLVTGEFDDTMRCTQPPRPCLDIVEEYVRSVDEYKFTHSPSDDELATVILRIADFMLEFATLSLEEAADVPQFIHPSIPNDDLASLGVPFLSRDKDGNSVLNTPFVEIVGEKGAITSKPSGVDVPMKANEEIPLCSTYFYHRWMWIQFPWVSLANCGERFLKGVTQRSRQEQNSTSGSIKATKDSQHGHISSLVNMNEVITSRATKGKMRDCSTAKSAAAAAAAIVGAKLPEIRTFSNGVEPGSSAIVPGPAAAAAIARSASKCRTSSKRGNILKPPSHESDSRSFVDHFANKLEILRNDIASYRNELDQLRQERVALHQIFSRTHDEARELSKMHLSTSDLEAKLTRLVGRLEQTMRGHKMAKLLYKNYECVKLMCERHPAHSQALIDELEAKLTQDTLFIKEVQQRLRESTFESHDFAANNKILQKAAQDMTVLQNDMLVQRIRQREHLQRISLRSEAGMPREAPSADQVNLLKTTNPGISKSTGDRGNCRVQYRGSRSNQPSIECNDQGNNNSNITDRASGLITGLAHNWESHVDLIRKRTFITDVKEFFFKFYNAQTLQTQMRALHNAAETRQRELKKVLSHVETELEQVRYDSQSIVGSNSREARELQTRLGSQLVRHKHARETALAAERLRQAAFGGVKHVCTTLGIPPPDQDTPVNEIIHQVESVLEALMEEKDKTAQKMGDPHQPNFRDTTPGYDKLMRAPELDAALEQFETPKALIAHRLPAKAPDESRSMLEDHETETHADETGVKGRMDVKREAQKNLRAEQRRLARLSPQ